MLKHTYEGAEVETDTNVLNEDVRARTSPCGHDVLAGAGTSMSGTSMNGHNVLAGDVLDGDVPGKDIMSARGRHCADVPVEDICVRFYFCPFVHDRKGVTHFKCPCPDCLIQSFALLGHTKNYSNFNLQSPQTNHFLPQKTANQFLADYYPGGSVKL